MSSFPKWARPWLASQSKQVSHGLNLVLELDPLPNRLPLLLWDIVLSQDKIRRALEDLSFVHFARFIPSWDARALMVTTEFDGPLDPYVLDFVIALGDVFDTLLSYVKNPPPMPVRQHPDEFLDWVRLWNSVPLVHPRGVLMLSEDYPLYSAYPGKTVTDIAGEREKLPRPALDRPAAAIDPGDVQGNILQGYRARQARYMFFTITDPVKARAWLAKGLVEPGTPWLGVASAQPWPGGNAPSVLTQVAFTHDGMQTLLAPSRQSELEWFPIAFKQGAAQRAEANFDKGSSAPGNWLFGQPAEQREHVVLFLYTKETENLDAYEGAVRALQGGAAEGLEHLRTLIGDWRGGTEPFGFVDGVSEPRISGLCPSAEPAFQPASSPGEFLLHADYASMYGGSSLGRMPQHLAGNGTFGVLRLMEQDVAGFEDITQTEAKRLGVTADVLRAKLVGRWSDGTPLALDPRQPNSDVARNAFDYAPSWEFPQQENDHEGLRCPVGAHIRRANPRSARVAGQPHARRLLRRGMASSWKDKDTGVVKVGLMGLFLGANIEQQFEFIQREWLQGDLAASGIRGTVDPIAAIRSTDTEFHFLEPDLVCPNSSPRRLVAKIPPLVKTRGCLYLFFPGIRALKELNDTNSPLEVGQEHEEQADAQAEVAVDVAGRFDVAAAQPDLPDLLDLQELAQVQSLSPMAIKDWGEAGGNRLYRWTRRQELQGLVDGNWREFIDALVQRELESPWVEALIDSFMPTKPVEVQPSPDVDQEGIDLSDARFVANPFGHLQALRAKNRPIVWVREQQAYWVIDRASCQDLLTRNTDFVQTQSPHNSFRGVVTLDLPQHAVVRKALDEAFLVALATMGPRIKQSIEDVGKPLAGQKHLHHFDFMQAFARPVARTAIWALLGVQGAGQRDACDTLADTMTLTYGRPGVAGGVEGLVFADAGLRLATRLALSLADAWLSSFLPVSRYEGTLIGELARRMAPGANRPLQFTETLLTLVQTVLASQSPHMLLTNAAWLMLQPDPRPTKGGMTPWSQLQALARDEAWFADAAERALNETRRCQPPLAMIERYAKGEQQICGVTVPDRCPVFAMVGSGNRDAVFGAQTEEFHWDRSPAVAHLSLGHGLHACAGRLVQEQVARAALTFAIQAMPDLRLSNPDAVPAWQPTIYFRWMQALPVARS